MKASCTLLLLVATYPAHAAKALRDPSDDSGTLHGVLTTVSQVVKPLVEAYEEEIGLKVWRAACDLREAGRKLLQAGAGAGATPNGAAAGALAGNVFAGALAGRGGAAAVATTNFGGKPTGGGTTTGAGSTTAGAGGSTPKGR